MPVDQHWPSVWPVAASFKPSVVPLPVRQGFPRKNQAPCVKEGNLELMKIPNFLHLSPPAIAAHCKVCLLAPILSMAYSQGCVLRALHTALVKSFTSSLLPQPSSDLMEQNRFLVAGSEEILHQVAGSSNG